MNTRAFTLLELILVMGIVALLITLTFPQMEKLKQRSQSIVCMNNLRQFGVVLNSYLGDHNGYYPEVETDPADPVYVDKTVPGMLELFSNYGATDAMLRCPVDVSTTQWYLSYKTSYEWKPIVDDDSINSLVIIPRNSRFGLHTIPPRRLRLVTDIGAAHFGRQNALYADGHVMLRTK